MKRLFQRVALTVGVAVLALLAVTTLWELAERFERFHRSHKAARLEPGTYQTRPAFVPRTTFTVGEGWDGAQETHSAWCVGKGKLPTPASFREALGPIRICVVRLGPLQHRNLAVRGAHDTHRRGVKANPSRRLSRRLLPRSVHGDHSLLPGIAPLIDLLPGGEQIFLNVRGKAVLLLIEISPGTPGEGSGARIPADDEVPGVGTERRAPPQPDTGRGT